jgi:hypothetical protein
MSFFENGEQEGKAGPVWGLVRVRGRGYKESVWEDENEKMRPMETNPGMGCG